MIAIGAIVARATGEVVDPRLIVARRRPLRRQRAPCRFVFDRRRRIRRSRVSAIADPGIEGAVPGDEDVVAGMPDDAITAEPADEDVAPRAAEQRVAAGAAERNPAAV